MRENIFKAGYLQRKRYSDRRILVTRCVIDGNAHLPACIIEAWAATARETDPEKSTHLYAHLESRFRLWLAVVEDSVIEREMESLCIRQSDFADQHHSHLLVLCVVCIRFQM